MLRNASQNVAQRNYRRTKCVYRKRAPLYL